jgi:hypothetical protein
LRALLDVNVLVAVLDVDHVHHERAGAWLRDNIEHGWATCSITQNGAARVLSQPSYPGALTVAEAVAAVRSATTTVHHEFWPDPVAIVDPNVIDPARLHGPRQITDAHLLALATHHGGRFATLDRRIGRDAVVGASDACLVVL